MPVPFSGSSQHKLVNRGHEAVFGHPSSTKRCASAEICEEIMESWTGLDWEGL